MVAEGVKRLAAGACGLLATAFGQLTPLTSGLMVGALALGGLVGFAAGSYRPIRSQLDVSVEDVQNHRKLMGIVTSVADGDTVRVRHRPWWASRLPLPKKMKRSDQTLPLRIAGVDCPEVPHGTKKGQPFGKEAKEFTTGELLDKRVEVKLLARDQYGRLVASVKYGQWPFMQKSLTCELLQRGLACVYRQAGAEDGYDGNQELYDKLEADARDSKSGMWSQGDDLVLPSEYKAH